MMEKVPVKVYGYKRVSTEEQVDGMSLQNQELAIKHYAEKNNFELVGMFCDEGYSAKTAKRPELQKMLDALSKKDNEVQGVVVYNLSRISRDLGSFMRDIGYHLSAQGIHLHSTTENIDDTPQGRLMQNIALTLHQFDNDVKSQTTTDNMRLVAQEGWWQGNIPYGYKRERVPIGEKTRDGKRKERLTLAPDTTDGLSEKVRKFLERFSKGDINQAELAQYAESIGLKSSAGGTFAPQSVKNMLTNISYAGFVCNKMTDYEPVRGRHPGIITLETFNRNQAILEGRKPDSSAPRFTAEYPLKHALLCSNCHKPLTGSAPRSGSGSRSPRYHCTRCNGTGSKSLQRTEELFEAFLEMVTPTESTIKLFREIVRRTASKKLKDVNSELNDLRSQVSKLDEDIQKALQAFLDKEISKDEKETYQGNLRMKRIELEGTIDKLEDAQRLNEATIDYVCNFIDAPARMWRDADPLTKIEFQKMVTESGIEFDIKTESFGTTGLTPFYRLRGNKKDPSNADESLMVTPRRIELLLPG